MKNLIYLVIGGIIGAFLTYYLCPRPEASVEVSTSNETKIDIEKPKGLITVKEAIELNNNWTEFRQQAVDSAAQKQGREVDNRSVAWSLSDFQSYLDFAKIQSKELGYNMTGLRVYLGVYGEDAGETKKDLTTMFIVPTGTKIIEKASSLNVMSFQGSANVPGAAPYNRGGGGSTDYP